VDADDFKADCIGRLDESECPPPPPMLKALHAASAMVQSVTWLAKHRLPRSLAVIIALMGAILVISAIIVVIISSINDLASHSEKYTTRMKAMVGWILRWGAMIDVSNQDIAEKVLDHSGFLSEVVVRALSAALEEISNGFLMLLFTVYLLLGYAPEDRRGGSVMAEIDVQVKRYIGFKVLLSAITGLIVGVSLLLLRVDLALVFGLLAFLLNFIPTVGGVVSTLLPMPVVVFDPTKSMLDMTLALLIPTFVHAVTGNFIEPRVLGGAMDLHPIVVLLSLMLWGSLWGVVGMILSVPITAVMKICLGTLDHPLPRFLAGAFEGRLTIADSRPASPSTANNTPIAMGGHAGGRVDHDLEGLSSMSLAASLAAAGDREMTMLRNGSGSLGAVREQEAVDHGAGVFPYKVGSLYAKHRSFGSDDRDSTSDTLLPK